MIKFEQIEDKQVFTVLQDDGYVGFIEFNSEFLRDNLPNNKKWLFFASACNSDYVQDFSLPELQQIVSFMKELEERDKSE